MPTPPTNKLTLISLITLVLLIMVPITTELFRDKTKPNAINSASVTRAIVNPTSHDHFIHIEPTSTPNTTPIVATELLSFETVAPSMIWNKKVRIVIYDNGMIDYNGSRVQVEDKDLETFIQTSLSYTKYRDYIFDDPKLTFKECSYCYPGLLILSDLDKETNYIYGIPSDRSDLGLVEDFILDELDVFLSGNGVYD